MGLLAGRRRSSRSIGRGEFAFGAILLAVVLVLGCAQEDGGPGVYPAHGIVEDVDRESGQVLIDHEDVEGLMPAMTMNFVVPDKAVLSSLERGQVIDFEIEFTGRSYEVSKAVVVGEASAEAGWRRLGEGLVRTRPAPDFDLVDQEGRPVALSSFGDKVLIVDFIFTECPGPCPVQTANQVALQRQLPGALRDRIQLLSISLDPVTDRPAVMKDYAEARGADLANWSFLTGDPAHVADVVRAWGIGSVRQSDGTIDHTLITFLVNDGRVMERYTPSEGQLEALLQDVVTLAKARAGAGT